MQFGAARGAAGQWASCIRIVDPASASTAAVLELDENEVLYVLLACEGRLFVCHLTAVAPTAVHIHAKPVPLAAGSSPAIAAAVRFVRLEHRLLLTFDTSVTAGRHLHSSGAV